MASFSERNGYTKVSDVLIRERITPEIQNAICDCYDVLQYKYGRDYDNKYLMMEEYLWRFFLNNRVGNFRSQSGGYRIVASQYFENNDNPWFMKLDMIEKSIGFFTQNKWNYIANFLIESLNAQFKRLNFAYRIIDGLIVEITSEEEIKSIEEAASNKDNSVKLHIQKAIQLLSIKPEGDYCNSIKESISAVEALNRRITEKNTLNLKKMEESGIILPSSLRSAFNILYGYTNDETTGIRHAMMDDSNSPGADEAIFMLVACSAFINYLTMKMPR